MSNAIVTQVYKWIIDNVVENVKKDFSNMGVEESILQEFQRTWEMKVVNSKVANFQKFPSNEDYYSSTIDQYTPEMNDRQNTYQQYSSLSDAQYSLPPVLTTNQNISQINQQYGQSPQIPQTDGANDEMTTDEVDKIIEKKILEVNKEKEKEKEILQVDGEDDDEDEEEDDINDEDNINSDLDDDDENDDDNDENETEHLILCQYEKVTRIKNKWKCSLKDGIINVNGKDYLFQKATGDFEW